MKSCTKCKETKTVSDFPRSKPHKDGLFPWCKACNLANVKAWAKANPEKAKEGYRYQSKKWHRNNPLKVSAKHKKWRDSNLDQERKRLTDYAKNNRPVIISIRHARRARLAGAGGRFTAQEWGALKDSYLGRCAYCFDAKAEHIDHVVPVAKGGTNDIGNLVPACAKCNLSKGSKSLLAFMVRKAG